MSVYMIDGDRVTVHQVPPPNLPHGSLLVRSAADLIRSPLAPRQLVAIWNALPDTTKIHRFKDRKAAVRRLWAVLERIETKASAPALPSPRKVKGKPRAAHAESKQARMVALMHRPGGATLDELVKATGWQRHTVRGAIAGAIKQRLKLTVRPETRGDGTRAYRVT